MSLTDKLANLNILLNAKSFQRWPLQVRFFATDVHKFWLRTKAQTLLVDSRDIQVSLEDTTTLPLEPDLSETVESLAEPTVARGIQALDVTYAYMKSSVEKSLELTGSGNLTCGICKSHLDANKDQIVTCSTTCRSTFHSSCLARTFLQQNAKADVMLPLNGNCPSCHANMSWSDLMLDLSLRIRGSKETTALLKQRPKGKNSIIRETVQAPTEDDDLTEAEAEADDDLDEQQFRLLTESAEGPSDDEWKVIDDEATPAKPSVTPKRGRKSSKKSPAKRSPRVVQDSDWSDAEVLD